MPTRARSRCPRCKQLHDSGGAECDACRHRNVTVVYGPPCAGKNTYVREHARTGDLVLDMDALAQALGSPHDHGHPPALIPFAIEARDAVVRRLTRPHQLRHAWVITSRADILDALPGAEVVTLAVDPDTCKARARQAGRPAPWDSHIDRWWRDHLKHPRS
ncbi:ATP-binding protein [Streptomyces albicerus]|uniref:ATP-binding protein n=1 Tax=Streptomyces albicerus TaxID=2569859 RepID=UPI00124BC042|nr:ATP-binding protein [Streptomyces albicerus]